MTVSVRVKQSVFVEIWGRCTGLQISYAENWSPLPKVLIPLTVVPSAVMKQ